MSDITLKRGMVTLYSLSGGTTLELPNPHINSDGGKHKTATFVNQGRNTAGQIVAQKIGRDQVKLNLSWSWLPKDEWEAICQFFDQNFFFNARYYDRVRGDFITREFYVGDRDDTPLNVDADGVPTFGYKNCVANIIDTGKGN